MHPKKFFSGKRDYQARNVHDDLLELLPQSTNETVQVKKLTSLNPRLKIAYNLYDKGNSIRDAITTQTDLFCLRNSFQREIFSPHIQMFGTLIWERWWFLVCLWTMIYLRPLLKIMTRLLR